MCCPSQDAAEMKQAGLEGREERMRKREMKVPRGLWRARGSAHKGLSFRENQQQKKDVDNSEKPCKRETQRVENAQRRQGSHKWQKCLK